MMSPISMNRHVQAFMLDKRQPSTKYRNLRCVQTEDSCVGVAMTGWKAKDYIDSGRIAVSVTVDDVALDGPSGPRGPCEPDTLNSCNTYYTTETVGNCQTSLSEQISSLELLQESRSDVLCLCHHCWFHLLSAQEEEGEATYEVSDSSRGSI